MAKKTYPSDKQDQFMLRLPDGMRGRIKRAAEANGRSMNGEIVAALYDWFPEPTAEEYLGWLYLELSNCRTALRSPALPDDLRAQYEKKLQDCRRKIIDVIDEKADPSTFEDEIMHMSDFYGQKRRPF